MTPAELVPSQGLILAYSATIESMVLTGSSPNQYYLPAEPSEGTFVTIGCVKDVPNVGNLEQEMAEHRCLDQTEGFIMKFPTGFTMSDDTTIKVAFAKAMYAVLLGYVLTHTKLTIRLKYAQTATETNASKVVRLGYIKKISDAVKSDGTEVEADIDISWFSLPLFTAGT